MYINNRLLEIVDFLKENKDTTIRETAEYLNILEQAVRYEINKLDFILELNNMPLLVKNKNGGLSIGDSLDLDKLRKILDEMNKDSKEERQSFLKAKLFFEKKINITNLSKSLGVSRTTVKSDILEFSQETGKYDLQLENNQLYGDESKIRNLIFKEFFREISELYYQDFSNDKKIPAVNIFYAYLAEENIMAVKKFIREISKDLKNKDNNFYEYFFSYMVISFLRIKQKKTITNVENKKFLQSIEEYKMISNDIGALEDSLGIKYGKNERMILADYMLGFHSYAYNTLIFEKWLEIELLVKELIKNVSSQTNTDISSDDELLEGLLNHIKPAIYRMKNSIFTEEDIYFDEIKEYKDLLEIVGGSLKPLEKLIGSRFSNSEKALFTLHFLASIERNTKKTIKSILLICSGGYGTSRLVANRMEKEYEVKVIDVISYFELFDANLENVDIIVSTIKIKEREFNGIPVVTVSPFFTINDQKILGSYNLIKRQVNETEIVEILDIINKNIDNEIKLKNELSRGVFLEKRENEDKGLLNFITKEELCILDSAADWQESIKTAGNLLLKNNKITEKYIDEIIHITETFGAHFVFQNEVAIPHGDASKNVNTSSVSILKLREAVLFPGDKRVSLIFFISAKRKKDHVKSIEDIIKLMKNTEFIEKTNIVKNTDELFDLIKLYLTS
ncbi:transcription antiterminator [Sebaldella sp. S0638]|uniref:BglG family transcription antiterminator n=1 Tax=Sebaldella sp. S0638 TaxID=2957809 RepID=UPI00209C9CDA|nr:PTS sugar transporter subunit IIA [Sebaldella sp. S0638]MCP1223996.1 PTS sugar transporter subunit IIA [Sebaldella sp. S0638]